MAQEDGVELFEKAANLYKVRGDKVKSAETFIRAAEVAKGIKNNEFMIREAAKFF